jgi:hypothetical protein
MTGFSTPDAGDCRPARGLRDKHVSRYSTQERPDRRHGGDAAHAEPTGQAAAMSRRRNQATERSPVKPQRHRATKPQPNCAKRLECVELAPAFKPPHALRQRQQAGRTPNASRGSSSTRTSRRCLAPATSVGTLFSDGLSTAGVRLTPSPCNEGLPVISLEAGCENKCASPYIGEPFGENSVGGKWLIGAGLRIPLTLSGRGQGAVGGEIILLNCCKWLQINRLFLQAVTDLSEGRKWIDGGSNPSSACKFRSKLKGAIETARAQVAELVGAQPRDQS